MFAGAPLSLQREGDLWSIFWDLVHARGSHSVHLTKVKGHASDNFVRGDTQLQQHKRGNDRADHLATIARKDCHGDLLQFLSDYAAGRFNSYVTLIHHTHHVIVCSYIVYQCTRTNIAKLHAPRQNVLVRPVHYPENIDEGTKLDIVPAHQLVSHYLKDQSQLMLGLARVLTTLKFVPTRGMQCGITWPELYLLALVASNDPQLVYNPGKARARNSIRRALVRFHVDAVRLLQFLLPQKHMGLFKTSPLLGDRLACLGYVGHIAHLMLTLPRKQIWSATKSLHGYGHR